MKKQKLSPKLTKDFIGYGHYKLVVSYFDHVETAVTGNMDLINRLNSDIEKEREEAIASAVAFVQEQSL